MKNLEIALSLLGSTLSLWEGFQKKYFMRKFIKLNTRYYEERNKPYDKINHAEIDNIRHDLQLLHAELNAQIEREKS